MHSVKGFKLAKVAFFEDEFLSDIPLIIRSHHEKYDGSGYPDGLKADKIPYLSRIITLSDAMDAMLSRRTYKDSMSINDVIEEIERNKGIHFDPKIAEIGIQVLNDESDNFDVGLLYQPNIFFMIITNESESNTGYLGNLICNDNCYTFTPYDSEYNFTNKMNMVNGGIVVYSHDNLIREFEAKLLRITKNEVKFKLGAEIKRDKYFSVAWSTELTMLFNHHSFIGVSNEVGGSHIKFVLPKTALFIDELKVGATTLIQGTLSVGTEQLKLNEYMLIQNIFHFADRVIVTLEFKELSTRKRDIIIRLLFRRQIEDKKKSKQSDK